MEAERIKNLKIVFMGAGNMAEALVNGLLGGSVFTPANISVCDPLPDRRNLFNDKYGVSTQENNADGVKGADCIVLAVKPQNVEAVLREIARELSDDSLVLSIAAGVRTETLETLTGGEARVVRAMPNTPALIGMGITAITAGSRAKEEDVELAELMLGSVGQTVVVEEKDMDAVTAVSGSGPAYVFFLMENMIAAGEELGLDPKTARKLTCSTVEGAVRLMMESGCSAGELRERVTSKGGTTAAALNHMLGQGMDRDIVAAVKAAWARSVEIAKQ